MIKSPRKIYPIYVIVDLILLALSFSLAYISRYNVLHDIFIGKANLSNFREYSFVFILWAIFLIISLNRRNLYITDRSLSIPKEISRIIISIFWTGILMSGVIFFAKYKFFSREVFFRSFFLLCISLSGWRIAKRVVLRKLIAGGFKNTNVLIIGAGKVGQAILEQIRKNPHWGLKAVGFLDDNKSGSIDDLVILGHLSNFVASVKKYFIDEVIITIPSERKAISELIRQTKKMRLGLRIVPEDFQEPLPALDISYLGIIPLITYKQRRRHPAEFALKRLFDFLASLILLILLSPVLLIIAIWIKLDSKGSVLYINKRSGFKGRIFDFYKFRSMVKEADHIKHGLINKNESKGNIIFKIKKDPRITYIGKFLRKFSIDELPQLINVLKGDMSLVGPRPFPVEESQKLGHDHLERLAVRPGITGLAQIKGRSDLSFYHWAKWDLWYVNNWSFGLDFLILWKTIPVVLKGKGAY